MHPNHSTESRTVRDSRTFSPEQKIKIVEESFLPDNSMSYVARKYGIHPCQVHTWRKLMKDGQREAISLAEPVVGAGLIQERILGVATH